MQPHNGIQQVVNMMQREIGRREKAAIVPQRVGLISSYDPDKYAVKVRLMPEDIETAWLPMAALAIGDGYGVLMGPEIDDLVLIGFRDGDLDAPYVIGRLHSEEQKPPRIEAGEMLIQHKSGAYFKIDKQKRVWVYHEKGHLILLEDDKITIQHEDTSAIKFEGNGVVSITCKKLLLDTKDYVVLGGRSKGKQFHRVGDLDNAGDSALTGDAKVYSGS